MRKHFLILMLLTLLPFAGWAEGVNMAKFQFLLTSGQDYYYTGNVPAITVTVNNTSTTPATKLTTADYDLQFYKEGTPIESSAVKAVGTYSVVAKAKPNSTTYTGQTAAIEFNILKMPLVVTGKPGSKTYDGKDATTGIFTVGTSDYSVKTKIATGTDADDNATYTDLTDTFKNKIQFTKADGVKAGDYAIIAKITDNTLNGNYSIASNDIMKSTDGDQNTQAKYTINPKGFTNVATGSGSDLVPATVTITVTGDLTYNGKEQKATVVVKDILLNKTLTEAQYFTDATATEYNTKNHLSGGNAKQADDPIPGTGDYWLKWENNLKATTTEYVTKVTVKGMGNYADGEIEAFPFTIKRATLIVTPYMTKIYDGTATFPTLPVNTSTKAGKVISATDYVAPTQENNGIPKTYETKFSFQGFVDKKTAANITINTNVAGGDHSEGNYDGDGEGNGGSTVGVVGSTTEAPVLVWADATEKLPAPINVNKEGESYVVRFENADLDKCFTLENYTFYPADGTYDITKKTVGVEVTANQSHAYGDAENYTFTLKEGTYVAIQDGANDEAALKNAIKVVKQAPTAQNATYDYDLVPQFMTDAEIDAKTYDANDEDADAEAKAAAKLAVNNYKIDATNGSLKETSAALKIALKESKYELEKVYDGKDISIKVNDLSDLTIIGKKGNDVINISNLKVTVTPNNGSIKNVGTYQIVLSGADEDNPHYAIQYIPSQYTISTRPLLLSIPTQNFVTGTVPTIAQNYVVEEILDEDDEPIANQGIAPADANNVSKIFKLEFDSDLVRVDGTSKQITTAPENSDASKTIANAIYAKEVGGNGSLSGNYEITYKDGNKGTAVILKAGSILLAQSTDLSSLDATATQGAPNAKVNVTFGSRELREQVWTAMVLPFNTTVREISKAFGYAVVDKFIADGTSSDMNFKIYMGEIPAYTPFLVKTDEALNLNTVIFEGKQIVKLTDELKARLTQSNARYNFIGTYKSEILTGNFWAISTEMTKDNFKFNLFKNADAEDKAYTFPAMNAVIRAKDGSTTAPVIFIEEADGTTTAINGINADGEVVKADGWYNLNGVKLQGVPTQKGIYINGGKKVVIK